MVSFIIDRCEGGPDIDNYEEENYANQCLDILSCNWGVCRLHSVTDDRSGKWFCHCLLFLQLLSTLVLNANLATFFDSCLVCEQACLDKRPPMGPDSNDYFCGVCSEDNPLSCFEISFYSLQKISREVMVSFYSPSFPSRILSV